MNALLRSFTALPQTFGELSEKVFSVLHKVKRLDIATDTCKNNSTKSAENRQRSFLYEHLVQSPITTLPKERQYFLSNNDDKTSSDLLCLCG